MKIKSHLSAKAMARGGPRPAAHPVPERLPAYVRLPSKHHAVSGKVNVLYLLFWISLALVAYFGMNALTAPKVASVAVSNNGDLEIVIPRSRNGHYYVDGAINGYATTFLVDTGATTVAIDPQVARAAGLPKGYAATFGTASGKAQGETVPRQSVTVGGLRIDDVTIAVIDGVGEVGLLGQNILRHMDVSQTGDRMILRAKGRSAN
ncbi:MAG: retroviral-like aspartic protease family protein [Pseudomonadota bacterium]|nr:retroviral-like aspartic protease family protein [Pseudomonadota bacterium]